MIRSHEHRPNRALRWARRATAASALFFCAGCPSAWQGSGPTTAPVQKAERTVHMVAHADATGRLQDAKPVVEAIIQLDLYRLTVPFGTVSQNEDLWRTIDEYCVDVATHDLLLKNGLRVGRAANAQWADIARLLAEFPSTSQKTALVATEVKSLELAMKKGDGWQDIFYYDMQNTLIGRTYERWENYMELSFQTAPRKPGHVRVVLCPGVRSLRRRLEFNYRNEAQPEIEFTSPERLYDMNLRADLPPETFLIVAPSNEGKWPTSIGSAFLINDAPAERMENVLLIVPKPFLIDPSQVVNGSRE